MRTTLVTLVAIIIAVVTYVLLTAVVHSVIVLFYWGLGQIAPSYIPRIGSTGFGFSLTDVPLTLKVLAAFFSTGAAWGCIGISRKIVKSASGIALILTVFVVTELMLILPLINADDWDEFWVYFTSCTVNVISAVMAMYKVLSEKFESHDT